MAEHAPTVALLFDDGELGGRLHAALEEHGARIVHEGPVSAFDDALRAQLDPDVLVVNLDDGDDARLDRLYELLDGERPRLVFNDASASRQLDGTDRARWARHLAVKVMAAGDVDPPRPTDARSVEVSAVPAPIDPAPTLHDDAGPTAALAAEPELPAFDGTPATAGDAAAASATGGMADLEAELNALLSGAELPALDEHAGTLVDDPPAAPIDFDAPPPEAEPATVGEEPPSPVAPAWSLADDGGLDALLASTSADDPPTAPIDADAPPAEAELATTDKEPPRQAVPAWSLVDDGELDALLAGTSPPAPDAEAIPVEADSHADSMYALVDLESAQAPTAAVGSKAHEMLLDEFDTGPSRLVLLGADVGSMDAVCGFLAALPRNLRAAVLLTMHLGERGQTGLQEQLAAACGLPVHQLQAGGRVRDGEVWWLPGGGSGQVRRDGSTHWQPDALQPEPSIDDTFTMAAGAFGAQALGIVFASDSNDAIAGAQAIHDRGGQIWVEVAPDAPHEGIAAALFAERLVGRSGSWQELAAHLIEVYP